MREVPSPSRNVPHPTRLRRAAFSREREKDLRHFDAHRQKRLRQRAPWRRGGPPRLVGQSPPAFQRSIAAISAARGTLSPLSSAAISPGAGGGALGSFGERLARNLRPQPPAFDRPPPLAPRFAGERQTHPLRAKSLDDGEHRPDHDIDRRGLAQRRAAGGLDLVELRAGRGSYLEGEGGRKGVWCWVGWRNIWPFPPPPPRFSRHSPFRGEGEGRRCFLVLASGIWTLASGLYPRLNRWVNRWVNPRLKRRVAARPAIDAVDRGSLLVAAHTPAVERAIRVAAEHAGLLQFGQKPLDLRDPAPTTLASCAAVTGLPLTSSDPCGRVSCIRQSISIHSPRAASEHMRKAGSARQSEGKNFSQGCFIVVP